jgi:hypothetical protein
VELPIAPGDAGYDGISTLDYERRAAIGGGLVVAD